MPSSWSFASLTYPVGNVLVIINPLGDLAYIQVTAIRLIFSGNLAATWVHQIFEGYFQRLSAVQCQAILGPATYPGFLSSFFLEKFNLHGSNPFKTRSSKYNFGRTIQRLCERVSPFFPSLNEVVSFVKLQVCCKARTPLGTDFKTWRPILLSPRHRVGALELSFWICL